MSGLLLHIWLEKSILHTCVPLCPPHTLSGVKPGMLHQAEPVSLPPPSSQPLPGRLPSSRRHTVEHSSRAGMAPKTIYPAEGWDVLRSDPTILCCFCAASVILDTLRGRLEAQCVSFYNINMSCAFTRASLPVIDTGRLHTVTLLGIWRNCLELKVLVSNDSGRPSVRQVVRSNLIVP